MIPHCRKPEWPDGISAARWASAVKTEDASGCRVALIGLADDEGVRLNGGRLGARDGSRAVRRALVRYGTLDAATKQPWPAAFDAGDIEPGESLDETHARVLEAVGEIIAAGMLPVGIGGGHDLTFPFVRAAAQAAGPVGVIYLDPHLDVRGEAGSGTPFRRLIETGAARGLWNQGFSAYVNSREHRAWFDAAPGKVDALVADGAWPEGPLAVSLDLDVIDQAYAPGVSATNPSGWTPREVEAWVRAAGRNPQVRCFDIMELSPAHDQYDLTARLAAHVLLTFLAAFAERPA